MLVQNNTMLIQRSHGFRYPYYFSRLALWAVFGRSTASSFSF
jgi:hypothetical protein